MATPTPSPEASASATSSAIAPQTLVGGRFLVEGAEREDELFSTLRARDQKTKKPIAIRVLSSGLAADKETFDAVRTEIKAAARLKHRSLVGTYGVGTHGGSAHFVACEWVQGRPLSELVERRRELGTPFSVRGVYNVIAHVCKALAAVHEQTCHGAVRPEVVWITRSGRVKVSDLGLSLAMVNAGKWALLPPAEQAYLAPEIKAGGLASAASDIFGVGALIYVMLTGRSPTDEFVPPSQARSDINPEIDAVVLRCLALEPAERYGSVTEVSSALMALAADTEEPESDEFGVDVEVDIDIAASLAPPPPTATAAQAVEFEAELVSTPPKPVAKRPPPAAPPAAARPNPLATAPLPAAAVAPIAAPFPAAPVPPPNGLTPPSAEAERASVDFAGLIEQLTANDAPRWMAVKNGLDHGPFTARELVKLVVDGEILEQHVLLNMDTNERKPLGEYAEFAEFVQQYKLRKAEAEYADALDKSEKVERRSNVAKFAIFAAAIAVLGGGGGFYVMSRQAATQVADAGETDLAAMFESGQVKIKGTAGILKHRPRSGGGGPRKGPSGGGFSSYEDAMNQAMELGDVSKGGGERQLRTSDIQGTMDRKLNSLFSCVSQELRRGARLGDVRIDMAILGSGSVAGVSVNTGSAAFKGCIVGKVKQIKFPSFPAPRMGARYSFGVD